MNSAYNLNRSTIYEKIIMRNKRQIGLFEYPVESLGTGNRFICSTERFDDIFLFVLMRFAFAVHDSAE